MIVNNFNILARHFDALKCPEDFFFVQILQRTKDGHEKAHVIRSYYFYNVDHFLNKQDSIIELCHKYNARAYFWVNPRNATRISAECIKEFTNLLLNNNCVGGYTVWDRMCGSYSSPNGVKLWIVDIDTKDEKVIETIKNLVNESRGALDNKIAHIIPTVQGVHLLTRGFDIHQFKQLCIINHVPVPDVHKNNLTLLYYAKD
jgi:hypothetical protein